MALKKPAVITDIGGNREVIEHGKTGFLVPPKSPQSIAEAVISCLKQSELAHRIGEQARQEILTRFSLEAMVRNYEILYDNAIRQKARNWEIADTAAYRDVPDPHEN
jgi:glycosyltransferase involved in cell wall biosynthesis